MPDSKDIARVLHRELNAGSTAPIIAFTKSGKIGAVEIKVERADAVRRAALPEAECWLFSVGLPAANSIAILDLSQKARLQMPYPHSLNFVLARDALDEAVESLQAAHIAALSIESGAGIEDETIRRLALLLLPELIPGGRNQSLFVDHLLRAFAIHVALTYGHAVPGSQQSRGGLATWQLRRAQEMLRTNMDGSIALEEVALACRLSVSHFSRAFRKSTGIAPYSWLRKHRIETAKSLLRRQTNSLSDIAVACGFSDQSHFTRAFHQEVGASPGAWRKWVAEAA